MPTTDGGTFRCPDDGAAGPTDRQRRLALQLADMIPGAATVRVSLTDPMTAWPAAHARVRDGSGAMIALNRTTATIAPRWILRVWPDTDWTIPHTLDLATATLTRSDLVAAGRSR